MIWQCGVVGNLAIDNVGLLSRQRQKHELVHLAKHQMRKVNLTKNTRAFCADYFG
jgi:uncharacterized protein YktB (UPF0637 family)